MLRAGPFLRHSAEGGGCPLRNVTGGTGLWIQVGVWRLMAGIRQTGLAVSMGKGSKSKKGKLSCLDNAGIKARKALDTPLPLKGLHDVGH